MKRSLGKILFASILTLILFTTLSVFTVFAAETEIDGVVWKYTLDDETQSATITQATVNLEKTPKFDIPASFPAETESGVVDYKVTAIADNAFKDNKKVFGKVTIPSSVTTIGSSAFQSTYIVGDIVIPEGVTSIGANAFYNCFGITSVKLPSTVTTIQEGTFYKCHSLTSVNTENITSYGKNCFFDCRSLLEIRFASKVDSIGSTAFSQCYSLHGTYDLSVVESMSLDAFKKCTRITSFVIPNLDVDILPLFEGCTGLESVVATNNLKYTSSDGVLYTDNFKTLVFYPYQKDATTYIVPSHVTTIGAKAFKNNAHVEKIIISNNVTSISDGAFSSTKIKTAYIPNSISQISVDTFKDCSSLEWVVLDANISTIGVGAFDGTPTTFMLYTKNDKLAAPSNVRNFFKVSETKCVEHRYGYLDLAPSCDEYGYNQCVVCDSLSFVKELGHSGPIVKKVALSCTTDEYSVVNCRNCNEQVKIITETCEGHISNFKTVLGGDNAPSYVIGNCLVCRETYIESFTPFKDACENHANTESITLSEAGCKTNGLVITYCTDCGELIEQENTPKSECVFEESNQTVIHSTCSVNGQLIDECSICGTKKYTTLELAPHKHSWYTVESNFGYEYSTCSVCGTFESRKVDYSVFNMLIGQISKYYETYYAPDMVAMLKPILENKDMNLTQEAVDYNVDLLRNLLSNLKFNVNDIPVVFIEKDGNLSKEYSSAKFFIAYKENGEYKVEAIEHNGTIKIRGNSTANSIKYPYNIKFSSKVDLFGMGAGKKYSLLANLYDQTLIRNAIAIDFAESIGLENTSKYIMVEVYYNGRYDGVYMLTTPVDVGEARVEIDEENDFLLEIKSNHGDDNTGLIMSHDGLFKEFGGLNMLVEAPEEMSAEAYSKLVSTFNQISLAIYSGDWEEIQKWVDVESMAKFYLLHDYLKAVDIGYDSTQFYIQDGKLYGGPVWDWDFAIGNKDTGTGQDGGSWGAYINTGSYADICFGVKDDSTTGFWANSLWHSGSTGYFLHLYKYSPEFMDLVITYLEEYDQEMTLLYKNVKISKNETLVNSIDKFYEDDAYTAARIKNWEKYTITEKYGVDQRVDISYNNAIDYLREWLESRHNWLKEAYGVQ